MATTDQLYLIPAKGKRVRDPVTGQALPAEGAYKPPIAYWFRRERDGDVTRGNPPKATKAVAASTSSNGEAK